MQEFKQQSYIQTSVKKSDPFSFFLGTGLIFYLIYSIVGSVSLDFFWDLKSFVIVFGGTLGSLIMQYDFSSFWQVFVDIKNSFYNKTEQSMKNSLQDLDKAILEGLDIFELREGNEINGDLLNDSIYMIKQNLNYEEITEFISVKIENIYSKRNHSVIVLQRASILAPSLGLFGTVIGLVSLLKSLSDPSLIGPAMSLALLTTAYGSGLSSLIISPLAGRVEHSNRKFLDLHHQFMSKISILIKRYEKLMNEDQQGKLSL